MVTPEDVYRVWHKQINAAKGRNVRTIKNFEPAKAKDTWKHFENCAGYVNRNYGHIDLDLYMRAISEHYEGWFNPKLLATPRALRIYKDYLRELEQHNSPVAIRKSIIRSLKNVVSYCREKNLRDVYDYLADDKYLIPTVLKHLSAGTVTMYFIACVPNIIDVFRSYPYDTIEEYVPNFEDEYRLHRSRVLHHDELNQLVKNIDNVIEELIHRGKTK